MPREHLSQRPGRARIPLLRCVISFAAAAAVMFVTEIDSTQTVSATAGDWLTTINTYRVMSGVAPVTENPVWSSEDQAHSCYMLQNGISHDEIPGRAGYTPGGDVAGNSGNVAVSSAITATARNHIDLWMTGPFHAIGILRPKLASVGFGMCTDASTTPWHSAATLDVLRGLDPGTATPAAATVFPGRGSSVPLDRFVTESPNPVALCGWDGSAGLPLIAMMPGGVSAASATLVGPFGAVQTCVLHPENTGGDGTAQAILRSENAVVVVPRAPLARGTYTATVTSTGGNVTWSFTIDPAAGLVPAPIDVPDTAPMSTHSTFQPVSPIRYADSRDSRRVVRLHAGVPATVDFGGADLTAVSANFTIDRPSDDGFLTVYNCSAAVPDVSTLNFTDGAVPNQAFVPLSGGKLCLFSPVDTDIIIDVNGYFRAATGSTSGFVPLAPRRVYDSREPGGVRLAPGVPREIRVEGVPGGAPTKANAVAVNLTVASPADFGFVTAYPCGAVPEVSNVNFEPFQDRPNLAVVPTSADGSICVISTAAADLLVDIGGYFAVGSGLHFTPLQPVRLLDTRSVYAELNPATSGARLAAGQVVRLPVAGHRGVPADAKSVSVNLTATQPADSGFVTAFPCGSAVPDVSNVNAAGSGPDIANGALVALDSSGDLCLYTSIPVHLLVDINGIWS